MYIIKHNIYLIVFNEDVRRQTIILAILFDIWHWVIRQFVK